MTGKQDMNQSMIDGSAAPRKLLPGGADTKAILT